MPKTMMNYQAQILNSHFLHKNPHICAKTTDLSPHFPTNPNLKLQKTTLFSTAHNVLNQQQTAVSTSTNIAVNETEISKIVDVINVKLKTFGGCKLGISRYPDFEYDAEGGSGSGKGTSVSDSEVFVEFDVSRLYIPAVSTATAKFLGLPLPPFLNIDIVPEMLSGKINQESGQVDLRLKAEFWFSVGSIYRAAPLAVDTVLTSEEATGDTRRGRGVRLNKQGLCTLVGVARVEPIGDFFMDSFLSLPSDCLACLQATISFN